MAKGKQFEIVNGKAVGKLAFGIPVPGGKALDFVMREYTVADLIDAEQEASAMTPIGFNAQLLCLQLERAGEFAGPFTINMIRGLKAADWQVLRGAQQALEAVGEAEPPSAGQS